MFQVNAHGDLHERINYVSREIQMFPDSASLYVKRGKLYLQHHQYSKSLKDLKKSKFLKYNSFDQNFTLIKVYHKIGDISKAESVCDELLRNDQRNVRVLDVKGQLYFDNEEYTLAAQTYEDVINYSSKTFPKNYLSAAKAWEYSNAELGFENAVDVLKEGLSSLGELVVLNNELIRLHLKVKDYDAAIKIQMAIIANSNRKESPYFDLGKLYIQKGDKLEALKYLSKAQESLFSLPRRIQNTDAMKELFIEIDKKLIELVRK